MVEREVVPVMQRCRRSVLAARWRIAEVAACHQPLEAIGLQHGAELGDRQPQPGLRHRIRRRIDRLFLRQMATGYTVLRY